MDENLLNQLSSSSGIPQLLLSRSIQARAEAAGSSPTEILNSWLGGKTIISNTTVTEENSYLVPALVIGLAFVTDTFLAGGGLQCTYGPINDRA